MAEIFIFLGSWLITSLLVGALVGKLIKRASRLTKTTHKEG
tara:strand:+ start:617 stop:739 length:123 start_codon:yes stop_codon:yes gene_type:complete